MSEFNLDNLSEDALAALENAASKVYYSGYRKGHLVGEAGGFGECIRILEDHGYGGSKVLEAVRDLARRRLEGKKR